MTPKRELSPASLDDDTPSPPATPSKKAKSSASSPTKSSKSPKKSAAQVNGTWTSEKRGELVDEVFAAGYKALNLDALAEKLELSKRQLVDQLVPNKPNIRRKAVLAVQQDAAGKAK